MWQRLDIVIEVLQDIIDNDRDSDRTTEANGFKLQINRNFVRYLFAIKHFLEKAKFASDMLQKPTNDLTEAVELIDTLKEEIAECRSRGKCQEFWDRAKVVADRLNLPEITRERRKKRASTTLQDYVVEALLNETSIGGLDAYVQDIYEIVDKVNAELCRRFDEKNITMMRGITVLCPNSNSFLDVTKLIDFAELFKAETESLRCEIATFKCMLGRKTEAECPATLLQLEAYLTKLKEAFFELHRLLSIACTLPVSSAECERNFSSMRLIKSDLRSLMKDERLDSLMMLGIHRDRGSRLEFDAIVNRFKAKFPKCRIAL